MKFEKFRELVVDPLAIEFKNGIKIKNILNYPHAGNDVLHCHGYIQKKETDFYIKIERHIDANVFHEAEILENDSLLKLPVPKIIEKGSWRNINYIVTTSMSGKRLSMMLEEYKLDKKAYCVSFGDSISAIHKLKINAPDVKKRKFHTTEFITSSDFIKQSTGWLIKNDKKYDSKCFIHGDHHYANILWNLKTISALLDWELSGIGNKEFDLAWAICLRPGQKFFDTKEEENWILDGYRRNSDFGKEAYLWNKHLILCHFYELRNNERSYLNWIENECALIKKSPCFI